jgi:hypothetical protein
MRKIKRSNKSSPEPYEDMLRVEKLDPYEAQIKLNVLPRQDNKHL